MIYKAALVVMIVALGSALTLAQRRQTNRAADTEERDWKQALASDTRDAYVKYFKAHQNTIRLGVDRGPVEFRITPHSYRVGASIRYGGEGQPQIQVETKRWMFTLSLTRASETGVIADDVVKDAGKAFEGADSAGGTNYATGQLVLYYVKQTFDRAIVLTKQVSDSSRTEGTRTELIAVLREDFSPLLVSLKDIESQIRR